MTQGVDTRGFDKGMGFVLPSTGRFGTLKCQDVLLEWGEYVLCKLDKESLNHL